MPSLQLKEALYGHWLSPMLRIPMGWTPPTASKCAKVA
ncbi:hypothetical protein DSM109990_03521 (plasmid) [Sulfitobacter dubius]|uniref:Uncharacterized protein n=1 Tax=Sulfitobacter dubius TaxID=218673 RepID=A0ABY3ZPQ9_9RHOB|nr:hypothetical protein DSM109990_03521 [Sulfitobacter dubius]